VPFSCDAVVEHEQTDRATPVRFSLDAVEPGRNIHPRGIDRAEGDVLLQSPLRLSPADIGVAAIAGQTTLVVARAPTVAIVPMLAAALRSFGANVTTLCRAPDDLHATIEALESIDVDLLITVGGVSQGTRDHVKPAWDALGATPLVDRVPIQPGKPTRCWKTPSGTALALPGNPVAAIICAHLFARPWVRASLGLLPLDDWSNIALDHDVTPNPTRTLYRAVNVNSNARLATWHGSGDLPHLAGTDGIVECAMQRDVIPAGTVCPFLRWTLD
jgi:molybdopterin molybdotransferase